MFFHFNPILDFSQTLIVLLQMPENIPQSLWKFSYPFERVCHTVTLTRHQKFAKLLPTQTILGVCCELQSTQVLILDPP